MTSGDTSRHRSATRAIGLVLVLAAITLPGLVLAAAQRSELAGVSAMAAVSALIPALAGHSRLSLAVALALGPASALTVAWSGDPWLASLLLGLAAGLAALGARLDIASLLMTGPISLAFLVTEPPAGVLGDPAAVATVAVVATASALWAAAVGGLLRRRMGSPTRTVLTWRRVGVYATVLAVTVALATGIVLVRQEGHAGAWFLMTVMLVLQPSVRDAWRKTLQRAGGTVVGFVLALAAYLLLDRAVPIYLVGAVFLGLAMFGWLVWRRPYWQFVALLTPAIVLIEGSSGSVVGTAESRLVATLLAAGVAVVIEVAVLPLDRQGTAPPDPTRHRP